MIQFHRMIITIKKFKKAHRTYQHFGQSSSGSLSIRQVQMCAVTTPLDLLFSVFHIHLSSTNSASSAAVFISIFPSMTKLSIESPL